jgi:phenylacetate-CoA ligase
MAKWPQYYNGEMETMDPEGLRSIQERKLKKQLKYVWKNSPFYRKKFNEIGFSPGDLKSLEDLRRFPFTTKDELRISQLNYPPLGDHVAAPMEKIIRIHSSSGTTGQPSFMGITKHDHRVWTEITARSIYTQGVRPDAIVLHAVGLTFFIGGLPVKDAIEAIGATFVPIGTGASDRVVTTARLLQANVLHCTPSYALYLAEYARSKLGMEPSTLGLKQIISGAEPGAGVPSIRKKIEDDYRCLLTEGMGNSDAAPILFGECPGQKGMHFCAQEFILCELIDPDTGEVLEMRDEATGELVYTLIDRECCPLIRFRTRDRVTVWTSPCECGRTSFRVRCIGRTDDMLIVLGVNVFPSAIRDLAASLRPRTTGEIQILLDSPGPKVDPPMKIQVEYSQNVMDLDPLKHEIENLLKEKLVFRADVHLVPEGTLPRYEMKANLIRKLYKERQNGVHLKRGV